jgi:tetratricopeptide (TPR) repeat protein
MSVETTKGAETIEASPRLVLSGSATVALLLLSFAGAIALLLQGGCSRGADEPLKQAAAAREAGDYKLAAEQYERHLRINPTGEQSEQARLHLANIYYLNLNQYEQALAIYKEFLDSSPGHADAPVARERMAEVLGEMGRSYEAIAEYERLAPEDPNERRRIRVKIADLYFAQKNYSQALTEYEKVIEGAGYDDLTEQAYLREASIYHIVRGQHQQALPLYHAIAVGTSDIEVKRRALYALADCYAGLYKFDNAIKILKEIEEESEQPNVAARVAAMEQRKREASQAHSGLEK